MRVLGVLVAAAFAACAPRPEQSAAPSAAAAARSGPECAEARARARADSAPAGLVAPRPLKVFMPPLPTPAALRGRTASLSVGVDSAGRVVPGSVSVAGLPDSAYARALRRQSAEMTFAPATLDGCAVAGRHTLTYEFR